MFTFNVICSAQGRVYTIQTEAETTEQAIANVKALAKQQGIKNLHVTAVVQVK